MAADKLNTFVFIQGGFMTTNQRILGFAALACASHLLLACAAPPAPKADATQSIQASTPHSMNQTTSTQKHIVGQLIEALKTERMLQPDFFHDVSLQEWFGTHQRTSTLSPLKEGVQRERLVFEEGRLSLARQLTGMGFSFNLRGPGPWGLTNLTADDLIAALGEPQKKVDIVAEQLTNPPRYPKPGPSGLLISPHPVRKRGETTHPLGNHDLFWQWTSGASTVEWGADINGDGSVGTVFGRQDRR